MNRHCDVTIFTDDGGATAHCQHCGQEARGPTRNRVRRLLESFECRPAEEPERTVDYHLCENPTVNDSEGIVTACCEHLDGRFGFSVRMVGTGRNREAALDDLNSRLKTFQQAMV